MALLFTRDSLVDLGAGWCSGAAAVICCQPVDTILTRHQAGSQLVTGSLSTRSFVSSSGMSKLWRGSMPMIGAVPFQNALLMAGYGLGKRSETTWGIFVGGCTGGVVQSFLMSPVELIKVHQQVDVIGKSALGVSTTTTTTNARNVVSHLFSPVAWKGLGATLLRDGIPHGIWFVSYEIGKEHLGKQTFAESNDNHKSFTVPLLAGAFAATTAWGIGYPADLIKTRIQAGCTKGFMGTARDLMKEPGGLYRGFGLKLLRSVPASMIGFVVYEQVAKQLGDETSKSE